MAEMEEPAVAALASICGIQDHDEAEKLRAELRESQSAVLKRVGELAQLDDSEALDAISAAIERDRKRPRVVSLGE